MKDDTCNDGVYDDVQGGGDPKTKRDGLVSGMGVILVCQ